VLGTVLQTTFALSQRRRGQTHNKQLCSQHMKADWRRWTSERNGRRNVRCPHTSGVPFSKSARDKERIIPPEGLLWNNLYTLFCQIRKLVAVDENPSLLVVLGAAGCAASVRRPRASTSQGHQGATHVEQPGSRARACSTMPVSNFRRSRIILITSAGRARQDPPPTSRRCSRQKATPSSMAYHVYVRARQSLKLETS